MEVVEKQLREYSLCFEKKKNVFWVEGIDNKYKQFEKEWRHSMDDSNEILFYTSNDIPSIPYFYVHVRIVACIGLWTRYWFNKSQAVTEDLCAFVCFSGWDVGCRPFFFFFFFYKLYQGQ